MQHLIRDIESYRRESFQIFKWNLISLDIYFLVLFLITLILRSNISLLFKYLWIFFTQLDIICDIIANTNLSLDIEFAVFLQEYICNIHISILSRDM